MQFFIKTLLIILLFIIQSAVFAQNRADDIVGYYLTADPFSKAISQVYVYPAGDGNYEGKLIWVNEKEGKEYEGLVFLKELTFNAKENEWQNGSIIYPGKSGKFKTYKK